MKSIFIDTSSNEELLVALRIDDKEHISKRKIDKTRSQAVLPTIDELLQKHELSLKDIDAIEVNPGPGSYTGLRVGVTIANTLGFLLNIPINGMPVGKTVTPVYS